ncbi:MAG: Signal peptidase-like protein, partial [Reichenbachiella sp.]
KNDNAWIALDTERVKEVQKMNQEGKKPETLLEDKVGGEDRESHALNSDLERMDKKFRKGKSKTKNKNRRHKGRGGNKKFNNKKTD